MYLRKLTQGRLGDPAPTPRLAPSHILSAPNRGLTGASAMLGPLRSSCVGQQAQGVSQHGWMAATLPGYSPTQRNKHPPGNGGETQSSESGHNT